MYCNIIITIQNTNHNPRKTEKEGKHTLHGMVIEIIWQYFLISSTDQGGNLFAFKICA